MAAPHFAQDPCRQSTLTPGYEAPAFLDTVARTTSIWSLRIRSGRNERYRSLLTIEVNNTRRTIVEVRGMFNRSFATMHHSSHMKIAEEMLRC